MGLLDDLIGQLGGGSAPRPGAQAPQASSGPAMAPVLVALAPLVIGMLRSSGQGTQAAPGASSGGLGGLLDQFQRAGFGDQTRSWVGAGQNMPLPPDAVEQTFGRSGLADLARRAGLSEEDTSRGLSQLIPEMVDRVTPDGREPDANSLLASLSALSQRLRSGPP